MQELILSYRISDSAHINAAIMLVAYLILAVLVKLFISKVIRKITARTKTRVDDRIIRATEMPIFLTIIFLGLEATLAFFKISESLLFYIVSILHSLIALFWTIAFVKLSNTLIGGAASSIFDKTGLSRNVFPLVNNVVKVIIIIVFLFVSFSIWKVDLTPLLASAGIASLIIALAAKDAFANFFGGVSVFLDKPYKIGDMINLDSGDRGEVVDIGMRSTRLKTRDDVYITIPNSIISNSKIINESEPNSVFRVRASVGVSYNSNIELVEKVLIEVAKEENSILLVPEPRVRFRRFGDSSLDFDLLCWSDKPELRGLTIHNLNKGIFKKFLEYGIEIPFPQRDVHIINKP